MMLTTTRPAKDRVDMPVVLRLRHCGSKPVIGIRPSDPKTRSSFRVWPRFAIRTDLIILLSALPLFSLAVFIGWQMIKSNGNQAAVATNPSTEVNIEPLAGPLDLPGFASDGRREPYTEASSTSSPNAITVVPPAATDTVVRDPNFRPMSSAESGVVRPDLMPASYAGASNHDGERGSQLLAVGHSVNTPIRPQVRIRSVEPAMMSGPTAGPAIPAPDWQP